MLEIYMGQCAPNAGVLPVSSLNVPVDPDPDPDVFRDDEDVLDRLVDPTVDIEADLIRLEALAVITPRVQAFVAGLSPYLRCVALRLFWEEQSQVEIAAAFGVGRSAICHAVRRLERQGRRALAGLDIYV
jgi:DNA-directed RNA polymerase specialized sigma24 family protein